ncbi:HAD family hydrolase [Patescibacteria group bacterium]|nr:HAD family hydrolase [Patescibacteria group bacterium]
MFIIDFDDTLFNTEALKQAKLNAARNAGVSDKIFWESYVAARNNDNGAFTYTPEGHAKELAKRGFDEVKTVEAFGKVDDTMAQFVFPDAFDFLEKVRELEKPMILLSLGNEKYQREKVFGAGIEKYFDKIIIVDESKERALEDLLNGPENDIIWLINDKPDETTRLKKEFPNINFVLKKAKKYSDEDYSKSGIPTFISLNEIYEFVRK